MDKPIQETIRVIDAINTELNYITLKFLYYCTIINVDIRNIFRKGLLSLELKYFYSLNMYRWGDSIINMQKSNILYLR